MGEVYYNLTKLSKVAMPHEEAFAVVSELKHSYETFTLSTDVLLEGMRLKDAYVLHFWDAVILATAKDQGIHTIVSEDQENNRVIEGVRYLNPFQAGFDLRDLG
jgi:predicted nucleic acid-binding protein